MSDHVQDILLIILCAMTLVHAVIAIKYLRGK